MKSTETSLSAHVLKNSQPEEFDLVILGGGTGSDLPPKLGNVPSAPHSLMMGRAAPCQELALF